MRALDIRSAIQRGQFQQWAIWALVLILIALGTLSVSVFSSMANAANVVRQASTPVLLVISQTIIMLGGGIDLSGAAVVKLTSLLTAGLINGRSEMVIPVIGLSLVVGAGVGLANGLIVTRLKVPPFIATLGTASIINGLSLTYTTTVIGRITSGVRYLYYGEVAGIPMPVIVIALIFGISAFVLQRTRFGRYVYAVGGNDETANLAGIRVRQIRVLTYIIGGVLAALAGIMTVSRMGVGDPVVGAGLEMDSITAAILGGVSLFGGRGTLFGALGGVIALTLVNNLLNLLHVSQWYQRVLKGLVIVVAVAAYKQRKN